MSTYPFHPAGYVPGYGAQPQAGYPAPAGYPGVPAAPPMGCGGYGFPPCGGQAGPMAGYPGFSPGTSHPAMAAQAGYPPQMHGMPGASSWHGFPAAGCGPCPPPGHPMSLPRRPGYSPPRESTGTVVKPWARSGRSRGADRRRGRSRSERRRGRSRSERRRGRSRSERRGGRSRSERRRGYSPGADRRRGGSPEPADARRRGAEEERPAPTAPTAEAGAAGASAAAAAAGEAGPATAAAADGEPQGSPAAASAEGIGQTLSATVPGTALAVVDAPQAPAAAAFAPAGGKPLSITEVVRAGMQPPGGSSLILNLMRRAQAQKEPAPAPPGIGLRPPAKDFGAGLTPREKSDLKEEEFKLNREMNPEPSRDVMPLQLLKDRCPTPFGWVTCVSDDANRSWMYLADKKQDIHVSDLQTLLSGVKWINVAGSPGGAVTRKTMWWVKEGCKCPYNYGTHRVEAEPFPDWFKDMSKRWLSCLNLNDDTDRDSRFPDSVNLNLYENGSHIVAWHSDDEPIFRGKQQDTRIISVSLGAPRKFQIGLRSPRRGGILKPEKGSTQSFTLGHGVLSTMEGLFQKHYLHQIAKGGVTGGPRINATFRYIEEHAVGCPMRRG